MFAVVNLLVAAVGWVGNPKVGLAAATHLNWFGLVLLLNGLTLEGERWHWPLGGECDWQAVEWGHC